MDFYGSICLSDIPKRLIKEVNGKCYLNINVVERKEVGKFGETHFIAVSCKKEEQIEGENRFIGGLKTFVPKTAPVVTTETIESAPVASGEAVDELPF